MKNPTVQWILRILGYTLAIAGPALTSVVGPELGSAISAVGAALLHASTPTVLPVPKT